MSESLLQGKAYPEPGLRANREPGLQADLLPELQANVICLQPVECVFHIAEEVQLHLRVKEFLNMVTSDDDDDDDDDDGDDGARVDESLEQRPGKRRAKTDRKPSSP
eukprot:XP_011669407.1 PREDICTED: uncharacterized protein LOC105440668 [Strongylocentrotus purpuratus]